MEDHQKLTRLIYGDITAAQVAELEARTIAFGLIVTGLVLEARFGPSSSARSSNLVHG